MSPHQDLKAALDLSYLLQHALIPLSAFFLQVAFWLQEPEPQVEARRLVMSLHRSFSLVTPLAMYIVEWLGYF